MKVLHILRSKPDDMIRLFIKEISASEERKEFPLYQGPVDYDQLVKEIFESDRIISWW
jgi:hypothetical protein